MLEYAQRWARQVLKYSERHVIVDCETTGLNGQLLQIGITDLRGRTILEALVRPVGGVDIEPGAQAVHGIDHDRAQFGTPWPLLRDAVAEILSDRRALIFNARFDIERIKQTDGAWPYPDGREPIQWEILGGGPDCVMLVYALWFGKLRERPERHNSFEYQKLPNANHSAIGDCRATLALIQRMASDE